MTTQQVADRLVELCRTGQVLAAQEELYHDDVACIEPAKNTDSPSVNGKQAAIEKGKYFAGMIEEVHSNVISDPLVMGNCFAITWSMDATLKGQGRTKLEEICVYEVKDGKIVLEQYFF